MPAANYGPIRNGFIIKSFVLTSSPRACASAMKRCAPKKGLEERAAGRVDFASQELVLERYRELSDPNNMLLNYTKIGAYYHASM